MPRRNFILLIIILAITGAAVWLFTYLNQGPKESGEDGGFNFISQFNPFSTTPTTSPPSTGTLPTDISEEQPDASEEITANLKKISSMGIAGFGIFMKERLKEVVPTPPPTEGEGAEKPSAPSKPTPPPTEFAPAVRYVDRATGNIYQTFADKIEERKFSSTVIPRIHEAFFGNKSESVIMRYLKVDNQTIQTFVGNLPKEYIGGDATENNEIKGSFLPENVLDVSLSADASSAFYLFTAGDNMVGATLNLLNNKKAQIFESPFTEWLSFWPNSKMITFTTKPAAGLPGYMYALDPAIKSLSKIIGGINGLTTLAGPTGKLVLYANDNLSLYLYHTDTKVSDQLGIRTLPEKCVWNKAGDAVYCAVPKTIGTGQYPDAWYQGEIFFSDQIWKVDAKTGNATLLLDPTEIPGGEEIDGIKLALSEGENYLFLVNKKDSFLWELKLK